MPIIILYKYYGACSGLRAIQSRKLGFRTPKDFNDPFELTALSNGEGARIKLDTLRQRVEDLKAQVVILSLTRSPLNPLMWAHYGQEHTGMVVGYDVSGAFLNSSRYNLIPAEAGDVIYTHTKSPFVMTPETMKVLQKVYKWGLGAEGDQSYEQQALARRLFLTKHASWVYEEEVRVVKIAHSYFEEVQVFQADPMRAIDIRDDLPDGLHLYNHQMPIKEIFLGVRSHLQSDSVALKKITDICPKVFQLRVDDASWQLVSDRVLS